MWGAAPAMVLGPSSKLANLDALTTAKKMVWEGIEGQKTPVTPAQTQQETFKRFGQGWFEDPVDKTWGFEISEMGEKGLKPKFNSYADVERAKPQKLGDLIEWEELFANHPEYRDIPITLRPGEEGGSYSKKFNTITIGSREFSKGGLGRLRTLLHEIQHLDDVKEGRSIGAVQIGKAGFQVVPAADQQ